MLKKNAEELSKKGITSVWLPPAFKCIGGENDVGYAIYDVYDLGEFDQKGSVSTKYGTKNEYLDCIKALQEQGINVSEINVKVADTQNSEMNFDGKGQNNERMNDFMDGKSHENSSSKFAQEKLAKSLKNNNFFEDTKTKEDETEVKTHLIHNGLVDYKI